MDRHPATQEPGAPLTPFATPEYRLAASAEADRLEAKAGAESAAATRNIQRATNYVLCVVLFSAALFFGGISTRILNPRTRAVSWGWAAWCSSARSPGSRRSRSASRSDRRSRGLPSWGREG